MPSTADLRRLADELEQTGKQTQRTGYLLAAINMAETGGVPHAVWERGTWTIHIQSIEQPIRRTGAMPEIVPEFLRAEAQSMIEQATAALAPKGRTDAEKFAAAGVGGQAAAAILRDAATLEELAGACDRGVASVHMHALYGRSPAAVCIKAPNVGHVIVAGRHEYGPETRHGGRSYYGISGGCDPRGRTCAHGSLGQNDAIALDTLPDEGWRNSSHPFPLALSRAVAEEIRREVGIVVAPAHTLRALK